jgi:hypothetical protein
MDDQLARCLVAVDEGWGQVLENRNEKTISAAINELLSRSGKSEPLDVESGAITLAKQLINR